MLGICYINIATRDCDSEIVWLAIRRLILVILPPEPPYQVPEYLDTLKQGNSRMMTCQRRALRLRLIGNRGFPLHKRDKLMYFTLRIRRFRRQEQRDLLVRWRDVFQNNKGNQSATTC